MDCDHPVDRSKYFLGSRRACNIIDFSRACKENQARSLKMIFFITATVAWYSAQQRESPYPVFFYTNFFDIGIGIKKCSNISTYSTRYYSVGHPIIVAIPIAIHNQVFHPRSFSKDGFFLLQLMSPGTIVP